MSEDIAARLRSLAREYSQGRLSLQAYRQVRGLLLDSLTSSPQSNVPPTSPSLPPVSKAPAARRSWVGWIGLFLFCVIVIGALYGAFGDRLHEQPDRGHGMSQSRLAADRARSDRIFHLVAPMLNDPDWTEARIAAVNAALLEEGARRIAAQRGTEWFQRFTREVQRRLDEQRALGVDRRGQERGSLAALAVTIGIAPKAARIEKARRP
jgi:hypothetical protein